MRWVRSNSLSLFFLTIFLAALLGQSVAGNRAYNSKQQMHDGETVSWGEYVLSPDYGQAVMENWQSEYLQFVLFILATIWLVQRGSNESKPEDDVGLESDQKQLIGGYARENSPRWARARGWRTHVYSNSLLLLMVAIFFGTWGEQSTTGWKRYNEEQRQHGEPTVSWAEYIALPDFWEETLQNWQSEFLAVGTMAVFTIFLRQRGSPESKPVGAPHGETGTSG